ncbi:hypothetical protein AAG570_013718 [Ranatra chinensis]|uniref:Uncharacterized protein n=1 Tax=Ranatra chinensis TaxID=642074 RepID=A0ABD0YZA6_9HEMI
MLATGAVCHCPQKCGDKLSEAVRQELLTEFQKLGEAHKQNLYLQSFIEMRSVYKRLWCQEERVAGRLQRRVSCKYRLPYTVPKPLLAEKNQSPPKLTTNSKGKMTFIIGLRDPSEAVEVCQKAFMNVYGITEKRIRLQREKLIAKLRNDTIESMSQACEDKGSNDETDKSEPVPSATTNKDAGITQFDIALVDRFFRNQLWKPEYIGMPLTAKGTRRSKTM